MSSGAHAIEVGISRVLSRDRFLGVLRKSPSSCPLPISRSFSAKIFALRMSSRRWALSWRAQTRLLGGAEATSRDIQKLGSVSTGRRGH